MASARGLTLRCRIDRPVPAVVVGDELRLRQMLVNLLNNAIKFTDAGTIDCRVTTDARAPADVSATPPAEGEVVRVRFEVVDTGIGIAESDRRHIFDRFTQVDDSSERRRGGAGLGLAICAQWVERMGGRIEVESKPGEGSRFSFELSLPVGPNDMPVDATAIREPEPSARRSDRPPRRLRILLADDAQAGRLIVAELLRQAGHEVEAVADGRAAVEAAARGRFDAGLIDIQMPELDGLKAVAAIRRSEREKGRPRLPIAALTADALGRDSRSLEEAGFDAKLTKPISAAALLSALSDLVDEKDEANPLAPNPEPRTLNQSALHRLRGNEKLLAELQEMFAAEAAAAIERLKAALAAHDDEAVFQTAHRLRGQLLLLGADEAAKIAEAMESASHEGRTEAAAAKLGELSTALEAVTHLSGPT
jgi:CheY-like chemotaxis protein/HPt (histidine-containing phosphotransfer) domain-containing protein